MAYGTLTEGLMERSVEAKLLLLAAVGGEHLLLVGPPGTAKSLLARRLALVCEGRFFERLLTRFSVPEEVFGPLSLRVLEADRMKRNSRGFLPDADVAFLDEIFKAGSSILNSLLTLLNERAFHDGSAVVRVPLLCAVGASNELPESEALDALYDRFLLRRAVRCVSDEELPGLLRAALSTSSLCLADAGQDMDGVDPVPVCPSSEQASYGAGPLLALADCAEARRKAAKCIAFPERLLVLVNDLRKHLRDEVSPPIMISDRRLAAAVQLLRVAAFVAGFDSVSELDLILLQHIFWDREPAQADRIKDWLFERCVAEALDGSLGDVPGIWVVGAGRATLDGVYWREGELSGRYVYKQLDGRGVIRYKIFGDSGYWGLDDGGGLGSEKGDRPWYTWYGVVKGSRSEPPAGQWFPSRDEDNDPVAPSPGPTLWRMHLDERGDRDKCVLQARLQLDRMSARFRGAAAADPRSLAELGELRMTLESLLRKRARIHRGIQQRTKQMGAFSWLEPQELEEATVRVLPRLESSLAELREVVHGMSELAASCSAMTAAPLLP